MRNAVFRLVLMLYKSVQTFKAMLKLGAFKKYAAVGEGLEIVASSNCVAERPGLIEIGNHCRVFGKLESQGEGKIQIGDYSCIYHGTIIGSVNSIRIGKYALISNNIHIYDNNNHPVSPKKRVELCLSGFDGELWRWTHSDSKPVVIEDNVWIGEYSAVMKGVTIGRGSIVASHSVVTKDVPPYTVVAGNPAVVVKELPRDEN